MSMSLKDFARHLSTITGLSPDAIYERQRELQAAGLFPNQGAGSRCAGYARDGCDTSGGFARD